MADDNAVDLTSLREMTGGDKEIEKQLFEAFISSSEECIINLKKSLEIADNELWRKNAHAMKGISLNLGAAKLGALCKDAQEKNTIPNHEKFKLLQNINDEYARVKKFLAEIAY